MSDNDWNIEVDRGDDGLVEFSVRIPSDEVESERQQALNELKQEIEIPGFRKGKVPGSLIEKKHPSRVKQALLERLVPRACQKVYQEHEIRPIQNPTISDFEINGEFYLEASVQEQPRVEVDPDDYLGMVLEQPEEQVTEEAVEEQLNQLLDSQASLEPIPIARPVDEGDFVKIDFQGYDRQGEAVENTGGEDKVIEVGSGRFIEEIEQGLIGAEEGEHRSIEASFAEDFVDDTLAGSSLTFEVTVKEILEQRQPDPEDEEFLEQMDVESLEELRSQIREQMSQQEEREERQQLSEQVYENLLETYDLSLPEEMVEDEIESIIEDYRRQLEARDRKFEEYLEEQGQTEEELRREARPEAERRIQLTLIFQAIAEQEEIEVDDDELQDYLEELSGQAGVDPGELSDLPEEQMRSLRFQLRDDKILDYLIEKAELEPVEESSPEDDADQDPAN